MILKTSLPVILGYLPVGMTFGLLAHQEMFPLHVAMSLSLFVYAGSAQFIAITFLSHPPFSLFQVFFTIGLVNLRHFMLSLTYLPKTKEWKWWEKVRNFFFLTDETFAVLINEDQVNKDADKSFLVSIINFGAWNLGTAIGHLGGRFIPDPKLFGLDFALTALFLGILALFIKTKAHFLTFCGSIFLSVVFYGYLDLGKNSLIVAALLSSLLGFLWEQRRV